MDTISGQRVEGTNVGADLPPPVADGYHGEGGGYLTFGPPVQPPSQSAPFDGTSLYASVLLGLVLLLAAWVLSALNRFLVADVQEDLTMSASTVLTVVAGVVIALGLVRGAMVGPGFTDRMRMGMLVAAGLLIAALV